MLKPRLRSFLGVMALAWGVTACGSPSSNVKKDDTKGGAKAKLDTEIPEPQVGGPGEMVKKFDLNKDKRADLFKVFVYGTKNGKRVPVLVRAEIDLNGDGKIDVRRFYTDDIKKRAEFDLDFDGRFDVIHFFDDEGNLVKKAYFMRSRNPRRPDLLKYYEVVGKKKARRSVLVRKERDDNLDGRVDYWEYWENGNLDRIGRDTDYDGSVDVWEKGGSSR
ncbi:MAG: hypothetical protein EP343_28650 [Deltaproteobacteria bacterium]|nr:MAG: hypothetical protein EP343_28650 [Deltaproteobacteria bacterium]